eukprot:8552087-Lingulodinium_polyedra.AAC.1
MEPQELDREEIKAYRKLAARLSFVAQDNPVIQHAAKEACRGMAKPTSGGFARVKKLVRFILGDRD